jgi:hypothetical protein
VRKLRDTMGLAQIEGDMRHLCCTIGQRVAGSAAEKQAADYTARRFRELGLVNVSCQRRVVHGAPESASGADHMHGHGSTGHLRQRRGRAAWPG